MNPRICKKRAYQVYIFLTCLRVVIPRRCRPVDCRLTPWVVWSPCSAERCGEEGITYGWRRVRQWSRCGGKECESTWGFRSCIIRCTATKGTTRVVTSEIFTTTNGLTPTTQQTNLTKNRPEISTAGLVEGRTDVGNVPRPHTGTWIGVGIFVGCIIALVSIVTVFLFRRRLNRKRDAGIIRPPDGGTDGDRSTAEAFGLSRYSKLENTYTDPDNQDVSAVPDKLGKSGDSIYAVPNKPRRNIHSIYVLATDPDTPGHKDVPPSYKNWDGIQRKPVLMVSSVEYEGTDTGDEDECYEDTSHLGLGGTTTMVENDIYEAADRCAGPDCDAASLATDQSQQMYDTDTVIVENEIYQSGSVC